MLSTSPNARVDISNLGPPSDWRTRLAAPAMKPPPGHISKYDAPNPVFIGIVTAAVCEQVAVIACILLRLYTQYHLAESIPFEDYIMAFAWLAQAGANAAGWCALRYGMGKHMWNITFGDFLRLSKFVNLGAFLYNCSMALIRLMILLQFVRLLTPARINRNTWYACCVCITANTVYYTGVSIIGIWQCWPHHVIGDSSMHGQCFGLTTLYKTSSVFDMASDLAIILLPMSAICGLKMNFRRKLATMGLFATGLVAIFPSSMRVYAAWVLARSPDFSHKIATNAYWAYAESSVGIVVFCLPVLPQFLAHIKSKLKPETKLHSAFGTPSNILEVHDLTSLHQRPIRNTEPTMWGLE